ncbi:MAG: tRNA uridine-5-carboxymethylaminomethyl(34) synthesis enzyme MnmG [Candidatus Melainabacteria bacterium]|nr:tRNA uridine-5-carboxymethylaminomethyl(34) synthesis enzyme MnmG [Candidatus Melainabacteria bacterium]
MERSYDIIVVGAGHSGCEAAHASAMLGAKTLLLALNLDTIALMPCNPAVGGPAKSHLVKEIDALGGLMGVAADATYLQLKTLNASKGPAVRSLRAQSDKKEYSLWVKNYLENIPNLDIYQAMVTKLIVDETSQKGFVRGVETSLGEVLYAKSVIITTGTFLAGKVYVGLKSNTAGRAGEFASYGLTDSLISLGFKSKRLKTGTPPRIDGRTINFSILEEHWGDEKPSFFSFLPDRPIRKQIPCHLTRTNSKTHEIILANLDKSPIYSGIIECVGPRYCPSIEDKVVRFKDKSSHHLFLEPEGRSTKEIYLQGCSTSLPIEIQWQIVRSLPGLENAQIMRPAYAVEYDYFPGTQFNHGLMSKNVDGLFIAGQVLGTSGYEEAAAQGIVAGINAARFIKNLEPIIFERNSSYIGTLIDDIVTKEMDEPYRMLTSRSEYRLLLRQDNADQRLTPLGREIGLVNDFRWKVFNEKIEKMKNEKIRLEKTKVQSTKENNEILNKYNQSIDEPISLYDLLKRPGVTYECIKDLRRGLACQASTADIPEFEIETEVKYGGYINRQLFQISQQDKFEKIKIPQELDFLELKHLSNEAREKLNKIKPITIGQASRIGGVSPADITVLLATIKQKKTSELASV